MTPEEIELRRALKSLDRLFGTMLAAERNKLVLLVNHIAANHHGPHQEPWGSCPDGLCKNAYIAVQHI